MAEGLLQGLGATEAGSINTISKDARDVAKAQGVAYEGIAKKAETTSAPEWATYDAAGTDKAIDTTATPKASTNYIDAAKSTVAGQLSSLLSSDSPYLKQADQASKEQMSRKGLLNSSIAIQAGQKAAYEAALPIAQQDAETYSKFGLQQQSAENQIANVQAESIVSGELQKQKAALTQQAQNIQNAFNARLTGASEESKTWLNEMQNSHDTAMQQLETQQNLLLQQQQINATKAETIRTQSSQIMQNYQISVENLLTDPDFLDLGAKAMNNAVNQLQTLAKNSIKFLGASSGVDMSQFVNTYLTGLSVR